ncbi:MAG: DUF63 family protein, partial [Thermoplasmata archaeon]|nr:DUF63 family protein [Thermoplasmata archaeon]
MDGKSMDMMVNEEEVLVSQWTFKALIYTSLLLLFFIVVGCFLLPHLFWDGFVVKYLWGPVLADAGVPGAGVKPGYNVINTAVYAYVLFLSLLIIHRLLVRFGIKVDQSFYLSLTPLIISGPLLRTLEDSGFFIPPSSYLFISPLIYIYLGLGALLSIGVGVWCEG